MKTKSTSLLLIASLMAPAALVWGDMADMKEKHERKEVKSDAENTAIYEQKLKETKAQLDQAQKDLAAASSQDPKVRDQAEKRVNSLQKEYAKLARKVGKEKQELNEDKQDLNQAIQQNAPSGQ